MNTSNANVHTSRPKLAIIGSGAITESFYLPAFARFKHTLADLVLVDTDLKRAKRVGAQFGVTNCTNDYREILPLVAGVIVAVPNHLHYSISKEVLVCGVHVLCEKPLAQNGNAVRDLIRLADEHGVTISVNNTRRLMPSSVKVKELLREQRIGRILSLTYIDGNEFTWPTSSGFYFNTKLLQNGVLFDLGAHAVDLICWWLGGKPTLISSQNDSFGGCEAVAEVNLEYNGCKIQMRLSRLGKLPNYFTIAGDRGYIEGGVYDPRSIRVVEGVNGRRSSVLRLQEGSLSHVAKRVVENFIAVSANKTDPLIPASEVLASIELLEEAHRNARQFSMPWYNLGEFTYES